MKKSSKILTFLLVFILLVNNTKAEEPKIKSFTTVYIGTFDCEGSFGLSNESFNRLSDYINKSNNKNFFNYLESYGIDTYHDERLGDFYRWKVYQDSFISIFLSIYNKLWIITYEVNSKEGASFIELKRVFEKTENNLTTESKFLTTVSISSTKCDAHLGPLIINVNYDIDKLDCNYSDLNNINCDQSKLLKELIEAYLPEGDSKKRLKIRDGKTLFIGHQGNLESDYLIGYKLIISESKSFSNGILNFRPIRNEISYFLKLNDLKDSSKNIDSLNKKLAKDISEIDELFISRNEKLLQKDFIKFKGKNDYYKSQIKNFKELFLELQWINKNNKDFYVQYYELIYEQYSLQFLSSLQELEKNLEDYQNKLNQIPFFIAQEAQLNYELWAIRIAVGTFILGILIQIIWNIIENKKLKKYNKTEFSNLIKKINSKIESNNEKVIEAVKSINKKNKKRTKN